MPVRDPEALINNRVEAIRQFHKDAGTNRAELDLSGGIDSAVMLGLLAKALGPENITTVYQGIHSSPESLERAREVAAAFGVKLVEIDITPIYESLISAMKAAYVDAQVRDVKEPWWGGPGLKSPRDAAKEALEARLQADPLILGSIRSCIRAPIGRGFNRIAGGGIRHGTGNECEDRWLRFFQKGGDGEVDCNPIAVLSKGEVFQLARALGVPRSILTAKPTPDLWGQGEVHNDEDEISEYLNLDPKELGLSWYSYVNPDTGRYRNVGLIERVSRFLDLKTVFVAESAPNPRPVPYRNQEHLFGSQDLRDAWLDKMLAQAPRSLFAGLPDEFVRSLLKTVRIVEAKTRHKWNPNCPTLGQRADLVQAGILTDSLTFGPPEGAVDCTLFTNPIR